MNFSTSKRGSNWTADMVLGTSPQSKGAGFPFADTRLGGIERYFSERPKDWKMRVPDEVKKAVVFLGYRSDPDDESTEAFGGTGFIVGYDVSPNVLFTYLVTADHVARELKSRPHPIMRLNDESGNARIFPLSFSHDHTSIGDWVSHSDASADVAVARLYFRDDYIAHVPMRMLLDDERIRTNGIGIGDETFMSGLFHFVRGKKSNSPIVRVGNIAMIPEDRFYSGTAYGEMEAYLIEARSQGPLSGSPVFVRKTYSIETRTDSHVLRLVQPGAPRGTLQVTSEEFYLLGLAHAHWDIGVENGLNGPFPTKGETNMGVAIVTPAKKILDVLESEPLKRERDSYLDYRRKESREPHSGEATLDSDFTRDDFMRDLKKVVRKRDASGQNPDESENKKS